MIRYAILTQDPQFAKFYKFIEQYSLQFEPHLNRTHVLLDPASTVYTQFLLEFDNPILVSDHEPAASP